METEASVLVMMSTQTWIALAICGLSLVAFVVTLFLAPKREKVEVSPRMKLLYTTLVVVGLLVSGLAAALAI